MFIRRRGERYIRHSQRLFPTRIRGHIPMWFYNREREATRSCIIEYLTEHIHSTDPYVDLKVVYTMSKLPRFLRIQLPKTLTLAIREDFQNCAYKSTSYIFIMNLNHHYYTSYLKISHCLIISHILMISFIIVSEII